MVVVVVVVSAVVVVVVVDMLLSLVVGFGQRVCPYIEKVTRR